MRFVVYGAGAIGGVVGGRLAQAGHEVVLIARGDHHDAIRDDGLRLVIPDAEPITLSIPVVSHPAGLDFRDDDVVLLAMKSQHTGKALERARAPTAPSSIAVVCVQNGVANEPAALRLFDDVYGVCVVCPALHLEPGVVEAYATPSTGILDVGRFPHGIGSARRADRGRVRVGDVRVGRRATTSCGGSTASCSTTSATRSTRSAVPIRRPGVVHRRAWDEGAAVLAAAGIDAVSPEEDAARRGDGFQWGGDAARSRPGGVVVAEPGPRERARSRPTTSTARSCCWAASTACPRR